VKNELGVSMKEGARCGGKGCVFPASPTLDRNGREVRHPDMPRCLHIQHDANARNYRAWTSHQPSEAMVRYALLSGQQSVKPWCEIHNVPLRWQRTVWICPRRNQAEECPGLYC
jgi:hypothetical protein